MSKVTGASLAALIEALRCLPGVGEKSAQRMAFHLLQNDRDGALVLSRSLAQACGVMQNCKQCNMLCEDDVCLVCRDAARRQEQLCVVEMPADQWVIENARVYKGQYFVLMGRISPLDGVGVHEIGLTKLFNRCSQGEIKEVIIATNFTAEGEATAHIIATHLKKLGLKVTRLAKGIPAGSELEYVDLSTIAHAYVDRKLESEP